MPEAAASPEILDAPSGEQPPAAHLAAENAALRARLQTAETSAAVQAMRAGAALWEAEALRRQMGIMRRSLFWRLTLPLRLAVDLARGAPAAGSPGAVLLRRGFGVWRREGIPALLAEMRRYRRLRRRAVALEIAQAPSTVPDRTITAPAPANHLLKPFVLIVAELSVAQCAKYRVWQKQEHFTRLGIPCRVVDWHDIHLARSHAALATQAILYRVPATPEILALIGLLESLGVPSWWEVDDLIFDEPLYRQNSNLADLPPETQANLLDGVRLYRAAMLRTGRAIASTPGLAAAMRQAGVADVTVIENALDAETLALADEIRATRQPGTGVLVAYGSGTLTHDADFKQAAPALARLMAARPEVRLRIVGDLNLPPELNSFRHRIECVGKLPYAAWLRLLGEADINIAPLEPTQFNDAKSCIKLLEAAILGVPSVCSPRAAFVDAVTDGQDGLLADSDTAWFTALDRLAADPALRASMGQAARLAALTRFAPEHIASRAVAPWVLPDQRPAVPFRVLFANVFYAPRSYGGATLVVEEMARRFARDAGTEVHVVTTLAPHAEYISVARRQADGVHVYEMPVLAGDLVGEFDSPEAAEMFGRVLDAVRPDVVHLHSVQRLSASIAMACQARGVPYVITLHDAWFLCPRQFMVQENGKYCFQTRIDVHVCEACVPGAKHLRHRLALLRAAMDGAALLLCPSQAHRQLFLAQGMAPDRVRVAPNGVRLPQGPIARPQSGPLRFAYVGGFEPVKGYDVLRLAMESLQRADWRLLLVDNTLNLGFSSVDVSDWRVRGQIEVVPAYSQAGLDEFFAGVDVLLFPSQWKESFGLTVREALARDVWVVATAGGGAAEAITDGINGTIIPLDGNFEPLAASVEALLNTPKRVRGFRNSRRDCIISYDQQAADLKNILLDVAQ